MEDWKYYGTYSGCPQGGIISPILANIYLNELDSYIEELKKEFDVRTPYRTTPAYHAIERKRANLRRKIDRREAGPERDLLIAEYKKLTSELYKTPAKLCDDKKLKYVRYADDLLIFCKSRKAAHRTYDHIVPFIEGKLFLKVNREKTKVAYIRDIKFLSYAFGRRNGKCQYLLHPESIKKMKHKIRELTSRSNGWGYEYRKERLQWYICGWSNYFSVAGYKNRLEEWDSWLRHRIRMCIWKSWKRVRTRYHNLKKLVPDENRVRIAAFCRKSYWRMSSHPTVHEAMSDERLLRAGYPTFAGCYVDFNKAKGYW